MVFTYFQILAFVSIVLRLTTQKYTFIYQKLFKDKKNYFLGSNFINLSENSYDVTHYKDDFFNKNYILFQIFFRYKNSS